MKKQTSIQEHKTGLLIILIALIVFATALVGSLTGASVYYRFTSSPIIRDPSMIKGGINTNSQTFPHLITSNINTPADTTLTISSQNGVVFQNLQGAGNAYACLDSSGKLYRSQTPCA